MRLDRFSDQPVKQFASDLSLTVGGPAANAAIAAARHGGHVQLVTKIGADVLGQFLAERLASEQVTLRGNSAESGSRSSLSVAMIDNTGERQTVNFGGDGFMLPETLSDIIPPDLVLCDNRYPELTRAALNFATENNIPSVMDAEAPFEQTQAAGASHIAFSLQGFQSFMTGELTQKSLKEAQAMLGRWICVTDGPNGVWVADHKSVYKVPAFPIDAADTVGAGDVWHGVFALQLGRGRNETDAVRYANAAAALKCRKFGGIDSCPYATETDAFLQETDYGTDSR